MATTLTTRLKLAKQGTGDEAGQWASTQNQGYQDADDRLFLRDAGDPDGAVESHYLGQRYLDTATGLWYTSTSVGAAADWTADLDILDAAITHPAAPTTLAADYPHGHLQALLEWVNVNSVKLSSVVADGNIYYDNNGTRVTYGSDIVFDFATDLEGAQVRTVSTPYYLYLDYLTGPGEDPVRLEPDPVISETVPNILGYHPTLADHRCVGSFWNNSANEISKFKMIGKVQVLIEPDRDGDHHYNLTKTASASLRSEPLNVPLTCEMVRLTIAYYSLGLAGYVCFATDGKSPTLTDGGSVPFNLTSFSEAELVLQQDSNRGQIVNWDMPVINMATPLVKYGHNDNNEPDQLELIVQGFEDRWAPRGY